jgi:hypothetical protein
MKAGEGRSGTQQQTGSHTYRRPFFTLGSGSGSRSGSLSGWVLRTACVSISRSSALVFAGSRCGGFHEVIKSMWALKPSHASAAECELELTVAILRKDMS